MRAFSRDPLFLLGAISLGLLFLIYFFVGRPPFPSLNLSDPIKYSLAFNPVVRVIQPPDFYLIQKNSLKAISPAEVIKSQVLADLVGNEGEVQQAFGDNALLRQGIIEHEVKAGETLFSIANDFDISLSTLLWANSLSPGSLLSIGKKLVILPVSGTMHQVAAGETLGEIVKKYKGDLGKTLAFNELNSENEIFPGDIIIVPEGILPPLPVKKSAPTQIFTPLAERYFICPITAPCRLTQGLHWYNAVDLSHGACGEPVYAAAGGKVQKVKLTDSASKWAFGGAGNHLTILHPNGTVTFYGHLEGAIVSPGEQVSQGQTIGFIGGARGMAGSGRSTGCHLHFQVIGARNPFSR